MKCLWRALAAMLLVFTCCSMAAAAGRTVLRVGYVPGTGFLEEDQPGHYQGYGYEYMQFLSRYGNWDFDYVPCRSWTECGEKLQSGAIDVLPAMPGDYRSLPDTTRTEHVIGRYSMGLVTRDGNASPHMRLGTLPYNPPIPALPKIAASYGFSYDLISYPIHYDMAEAFDRGEIDGYIAPLLEPNKAQNVLSEFDRQSYRLLVRSDRTDLLGEMNKAMEEMLTDQFDIRERLQNKYLRTGGVPLILSPQEREYLAGKKKLTTAIFMREPPYIYWEDDEAKGVIPEILRQISKDLGVEIEIIPTESSAEAMRLIQMGKIDFLGDVICDFSWAGEQNVVPTQSYLQIDFVPVHRRNAILDDNATVACVPTHQYTASFIAPRYPEKRCLNFEDIEECFRAVGEGRATLLFAPRNEVPFLMEETGAYNLEASTETAFTAPLSLGVYVGADPRLWRILNKEINHLDITKVQSLLDDSSKSVQHLSPQWLVYHYPLHVLGAAMLIMGIIAAAFVYRARMRREHFDIVHHMAYTDMRYQLPNLLWLGKESPAHCERIRKNEPGMQIYVAVFAMDSKTAIALPYGKELLENQLKDMAEQMQKMNWVVLTAAGSDAGHLICICKSRSDADISRLAESAVAKYGYIETQEARIWLHMQAGLCLLPEADDSLSHAIECAHAASHEAEKSNTPVKLFDAALQEELIFAQKIEGCMERALREGEFHAWYQPKYSLETHKITGAEALVRWQSKEMGFLPPGKFIPLFERNGFVIPLDHFLLEEVFRLQKKCLEEGRTPVTISVNQSRLHMTEEDYLEKMRALVKKYKLPKGLIELELTETVFGDFDQKAQREQAASTIHALKEMGFTISVDDFGSGYSSYTLLNYLPMDVMKIDRSLLVASDDSDRMRSILGNIIQLGRLLNMKVLCEGIETPEQELLLLELGCEYGQGYLNAKPMPEADYLAFWEAHC